MKANELQISDWVNFLIDVEGGDTENDPQNEVYQPMQVNTIASWEVGGEVESREGVINDPEQLLPIPLTAEILEKNGFVEFMPHNWQIVIDNIMIEIREPEHNMAIWLDWNEHDTGTYASYIFPVPNYVHELQHALRLCNINKEIEL